jgi:invasion protein IalB
MRRTGSECPRIRLRGPPLLLEAKLILLILVLIGAKVAHGATITIGSRSEGQPPLVLVDGKIEPGDGAQFRLKTSFLSGAIVSFRSDGGSVAAGIQIGEIIRLKGFTTSVSRDASCVSACALAWLGGTKRSMSAESKIGFHAAYTADGRETGVGNALIGAYLNKIGLPYSAVVYITQAAARSMTWLSAAEAKKHGIDVELVGSPQVANAPAPAVPPAAPAPPRQASPGAGPPAGPGAAPEIPRLIYSPWAKFCGNGNGPGAKEVCFTEREARTEAGQPVASALLIEPEGNAKKLLRVTLTSPLQLQYGARIVVDEQPAIGAAFVSCAASGCLADYEATPDLIGKLKKGQTLGIQAINLAAAKITFPLPLAEFAQANERPPVAQPSGEQRRRLGELREPYLDKSAPIDPLIGQLVYSPWAKFCGKGKDPGTKEVCFTGKDARTEAGRPVVAAALIEPEGESKKLFRITLPSSVHLQYGTRLIIDKEPPISARFFTCFTNGCMADYEATPELVGKLKKGQMLRIQAINLAIATISFPMPLADNSGNNFQKAHEGPPTGP